jgi:hypothetical protein
LDNSAISVFSLKDSNSEWLSAIGRLLFERRGSVPSLMR